MKMIGMQPASKLSHGQANTHEKNYARNPTSSAKKALNIEMAQNAAKGGRQSIIFKWRHAVDAHEPPG